MPDPNAAGLFTSLPFALFENTRDPAAPARLYRHPLQQLVARRPEEVLPLLEAVEAALERGLHACGYIAYEAGYALNRLPLPEFAAAATMPLALFALFEHCEHPPAEEIEAVFAACPPSAVFDLVLGEDALQYTTKIEAIRNAIAAGETYQVNHTLPCRFRFGGAPADLYAALRKAQPVAYSAFLQLDAQAILSLSPELFLERQGTTLRTRPMKGTAPRRADPALDAAEARRLTEDAKTQAENLMIVDLLRNDLGRVAETGSVQVTRLFEIETYATLHQMTSSITATLRAGTSLPAIMAGLFPCGSVTGAPKRHTMELIARLEGRPRGVYTGAIGYLEPGGDFCFNVPIRTVMCAPGHQAEMGVGSGIVHDSQAAAEYAEVQLKTRFLSVINHDLQLIESMRLEVDGHVPLLDLHLQRLQQSAQALGFVCDATAVQTAILAHARHHAGEARQRLRLALAADGSTTLSCHALPAVPEQPVVLISPHRIDSQDPLRRHKTTARNLYEAEYLRAVAQDAYEVLFLNEQGELAEAARHNVFVEDEDGCLLTPPISSGALPGVLRQQLIASGRAREGRVDMLALKKGKKLFIGNAVRGLQAVHLAD